LNIDYVVSDGAKRGYQQRELNKQTFTFSFKYKH